MFKTRLLSGIVLVAVALLTIISGGYVLFFTLLGISLIGMQELYKVMKVREDHFNALEIAGYLGAVIYYVLMSLDFEKYGMMGVIISFMMFMFVYGIHLSQVQGRSGNAGVLWGGIRGCDALLYLSYQEPSGWKISGMADLFMLLGMRYLRILCGNADRQAQNGTNPQPEEISRRWSRRRGRRCASGRNLCSSNWRKDCRVCANLCSRSTDLHGWRPGCFCY